MSGGVRYFRRRFVFEAMDLHDDKTGVLETYPTQSIIHYACSDAIFRGLILLPVATLIDEKISLRVRMA